MDVSLAYHEDDAELIEKQRRGIGYSLARFLQTQLIKLTGEDAFVETALTYGNHSHELMVSFTTKGDLTSTFTVEVHCD